MTNPNSLLLIPDISGFTDFVHNTEISHARHIISELLEILIDANTNDLELAEIEGDALFYYRHGAIINYQELINQIKGFYLAFHRHLQLYESRRICQCGACTGAAGLKIKFVVHAGSFDFIEVKGKRKPIGSSVIAVHRLLKNDIPSDEYILLTNDYVKTIEESIENWQMAKANYDHLGDISYHFKDITSFKSELEDIPKTVSNIIDNPLVVEMDFEVNRNVLDVYELLTNFNLRRMWNLGINDLLFNKDKLNQAGVMHTCVIDGKSIDFESIRSESEDGQWIYGEQTNDIPFMKRVLSYNILNPKSENKTIITLKTQFEPQNLFGRILFPLIKKKFADASVRSFNRLKELAESPNAPV